MPVALGLIALLAIGAYNFGVFSPKKHTAADQGAAVNPNTAAVVLAERAVPDALKSPSLIFDKVWAVKPQVACGIVDAGSGARTSRRRFIFENGAVRFDDGSATFGDAWNALCAAGAAPAPNAVHPASGHRRH
jgi:hypothetical protein